MKEAKPINTYNDTVKLSRLAQVYQLQVSGMSLTAALLEIGIAKATFYKWIDKDLLGDLMKAQRAFYIEHIGQQVLAALPGVVKSLAAQAIREDDNDAMPAKKMLWQMATFFMGGDASAAPSAPPVSNIQLFVPQMVKFNIAEGRPKMSDAGHLVVDVLPIKG